MRCPHCEIEIPEAAIMSEAGRIAQRRRRTRKGQPPKTFACRWCGAAIQRRGPFDAHERECSQRPPGGLIEITAADMAALVYVPH
jgi:hypothetical protein